MKRELQIITACENKLMYTWQVRVLCNNYRRFDLSDKLQVLVFVHINTKALQQWHDIQKDYPEVEIYFYLDNEDIYTRQILPCGYIPLIRPYLLSNHFASLPELEKKAIWYIDPDCLLTKRIDFDKYLLDDTVYMSDCKWYIGSQYFDSKINDVKKDRLEAYQEIDVLNEAASICGINRKICEKNFNHSGGAQSLLKNVDWAFFVELYHNCMELYNYFHFSKDGINAKYFDNEDTGFQSWAVADMNGLLWGLWKRKIKTRTPDEFNFAWNTHGLQDIEILSMYHDAGYNGNEKGFNKYSFANVEPWNIRLSDYKNGLCSEWYCEQIIKAKPKNK